MTDDRDPIPPGILDMLVLRTLVAAEREWGRTYENRRARAA
jgi:hypothetical protein